MCVCEIFPWIWGSVAYAVNQVYIFPMHNQLPFKVVFKAVSGGRVTSQGWTQGDCPACGGKQKFAVHFELGRYSCLKCRVGGSLNVKDLNKYRPTPQREVIPHILGEERPGITPPPEFVPFTEEKSRRWGVGRRMWEYALGRGISGDTLVESGTGYIDYSEDFAYRKRLVVPILDTNQKTWLGFSSRKLDPELNDPWKYLYNRRFDRQTCLYNSRTVITPDDKHPIWVVEGALDALYFWPYGVAVLGTYGPYQLHLLRQAQRPVIVVLDGDAHRIGLRFALSLQDLGVWAGCVRLPPKKDPDNMSKQWLYEQAYTSLEQGLL